MKKLLPVLGALLIAACANDPQVVGERVTLENGEVYVCGEGDDLPECRDYNNLTYSENLKMKEPTDKQMATEAGKVREETPAQLERTITELEQNPDTLDTVAE